MNVDSGKIISLLRLPRIFNVLIQQLRLHTS